MTSVSISSTDIFYPDKHAGSFQCPHHPAIARGQGICFSDVNHQETQRSTTRFSRILQSGNTAPAEPKAVAVRPPLIEMCRCATLTSMSDENTRRSTVAPVGAAPDDVNILPAHFHGEDATQLHLRLSAGLVRINRERLVGGEHGGGRVDIHVRPEHLRFVPLTADSALTGTVVDHVLQGEYVDTYVDVNFASGAGQRVIVRSKGADAVERFPIGSVTALALPSQDMTLVPKPVSP
jgi:hypothetical protein